MSSPFVDPTGSFAAGRSEPPSATQALVSCPICNRAVAGPALQKKGNYALFACSPCSLQFWSPRVLPTSEWYELIYSGRAAKLLPLQPGPNHFLSHPKPPHSAHSPALG